jgi:hypothetical protein
MSRDLGNLSANPKSNDQSSKSEKKGVKYNGLVKSPSAALRFNLVVAAHP